MTVSDDIARAARRPPAVAVRDHLARPLRRLVQALPHGGSLPDAAFWARHRLITVVVWLQLPLIAAVGAGGPNALGVGGGRSPA
ncbi:MAG TPA: hypothetical protein VNT51_09415, partial [Miltoncostaeaceae bacterium]|nr:hypothetical protein [Miltoncostaeaceae bacterium]